MPTTASPNVTPASSASHAAGSISQLASMRGEIASKWSKFSSTEIAALKNRDDLVALLQSKYSLDRSQAVRDVESFARGRTL